MGFWFDKENTFVNSTEPFEPRVTEAEMQELSFSKRFQAEMYSEHVVLSQLISLLTTMLVSCRTNSSKTMRVSEEDLEFLLDVAHKRLQLKKPWRCY